VSLNTALTSEFYDMHSIICRMQPNTNMPVAMGGSTGSIEPPPSAGT